MLSDAESDSVSEIHQLTINEHYAKAFQYKKEREELTKLKEKYGSDAEESDITDSDSEEDVTEDEDGEELTPALDAAILRTLARIKKKDPEIYDSKKAIFDEEQQKVTVSAQPSKKVKKDKSKPLTIRQAALASALDTTSRSPSPEPPTYVQEQDALRKETVQAFHGAINIGDDDDDDGDFLVPREMVKDDAEMEEEEYRAFLEREVGSELKDLVTVEAGQVNIIEEERADGPIQKNKKGDESQSNNDKKKKKKKKSDANGAQTLKSKEEADHEFLMNYILNRGWIDHSFRRLPTHKDIVGESTTKPKEVSSEDNAAEDKLEHIVENPDDLSGDDEFEEVNELFETSYNFRFEEPDGMTIKTHPRNISATVRREDSTRKEARERRKQRKEEELQRRREEVKRLKALKLRELRKKLERIGKEGGRKLDDDLALQDLDLEADWNPDAHDKQMNELYGAGDGEEAEEEEKPHWDDDIDIGDIVSHDAASSSKVEKKKKKKKKNQADEDDDQGVDIDVMDADIDNTANDEEWDGTEEMRKRVLSKYMDELHELDFNDIVADMPTRFKYTSVPSQDFQLTPAEILMADDADLNQYMSIKKYAPYRKSSTWDRNRGERLKEFKQKFKSSTLSKTGPSDGEPKKRKGKKERMRLKQMEEEKEAAERNDSLAGKLSTRDDKKAADEDIEENGKRKRMGVVDDHDQHTQETKKKRKRRKKNADSATSHT